MFSIIKNFNRYIDLNFQKTDILAFLAIAFSIVYIKIFNLTEIPENSFLENLSLIPLISGIFICWKAKDCKTFFKVVSLIFFLMIMRELSYGRVIFCAIPNQPNEFYPWSHYKYGYLAHIFVGIYIFGIFIYGFLNKIWLDIIKIIKKVKLPIWTFLYSFICVFLQIFFERIGNTVIEETAELALYCLMVSICIIYINKLKNKKRPLFSPQEPK